MSGRYSKLSIAACIVVTMALSARAEYDELLDNLNLALTRLKIASEDTRHERQLIEEYAERSDQFGRNLESSSFEEDIFVRVAVSLCEADIYGNKLPRELSNKLLKSIKDNELGSSQLFRAKQQFVLLAEARVLNGDCVSLIFN